MERAVNAGVTILHTRADVSTARSRHTVRLSACAGEQVSWQSRWVANGVGLVHSDDDHWFICKWVPVLRIVNQFQKRSKEEQAKLLGDGVAPPEREVESPEELLERMRLTGEMPSSGTPSPPCGMVLRRRTIRYTASRSCKKRWSPPRCRTCVQSRDFEGEGYLCTDISLNLMLYERDSRL